MSRAVRVCFDALQRGGVQRDEGGIDGLAALVVGLRALQMLNALLHLSGNPLGHAVEAGLNCLHRGNDFGVSVGHVD